MNSSSSSGNLSLPGGFKMANSSNKYCDVATATGSLNSQSSGSLVTEGFSKDWGSWSFHCQGSIVVSKWTWCLRESCRSTSWPSTSLASWSSWCPGSPSGWTTRRCQPGWPWGWPPCWPCPPPWARSRGVCPQWRTPRRSTSGQASVSSSSSVLFLNMLLSTMHRGELWNKCPLSSSIGKAKEFNIFKGLALSDISQFKYWAKSLGRCKMENIKSRSDAQRASKQKEMKEKELELCAFNAEHIEDSGHTHSLVRYFVCWVLTNTAGIFRASCYHCQVI